MKWVVAFGILSVTASTCPKPGSKNDVPLTRTDSLCILQKTKAISEFNSGEFQLEYQGCRKNAYFVEEIYYKRYGIKPSIDQWIFFCGVTDSLSEYLDYCYSGTIDSLMSSKYGRDVYWRVQHSADSLAALYPYRYDTRSEFSDSPIYIPNQDSMYSDLRKVIHYPPRAKHDTVQGTVYVKIKIDTLGNIAEASIQRSVRSDLNSAALVGVQQLGKFQPIMRWGIAQECTTIIPVRFKLE